MRPEGLRELNRRSLWNGGLCFESEPADPTELGQVDNLLVVGFSHSPKQHSLLEAPRSRDRRVRTVFKLSSQLSRLYALSGERAEGGDRGEHLGPVVPRTWTSCARGR